MNTYIAKSNIHGFGVFASQDISANIKICNYIGEEMDWKTFKSKYGEYKKNSQYTYPMRRIWRVIVAKEEPYKSLNIVNYINETEGTPNCVLRKRALFTCKDILKDTELVLEYPKDYNRYWNE